MPSEFAEQVQCFENYKSLFGSTKKKIWRHMPCVELPHQGSWRGRRAQTFLAAQLLQPGWSSVSVQGAESCLCQVQQQIREGSPGEHWGPLNSNPKPWKQQCEEAAHNAQELASPAGAKKHKVSQASSMCRCPSRLPSPNPTTIGKKTWIDLSCLLL